MKQPNLHELINLPYGQAHKKLEEAGHYRDADLKEYTVRVGGYYTPEHLYETFTVQATSEEHAFARAEKLSAFEVFTSFELVDGE